jgi:3-deoxy-7-phosphoheptulonate synthase
MIVVLKDNPDQKQLDNLIQWLESLNIDINISEGRDTTILGLIGDTSVVDIDLISALDIVEAVKRITEPYKNANRKFHPDDTVLDINGVKIGGGNFQLIAGPCSVESMEQVCSIAESVKGSGAGMLRGGAFKPRTSPYAFQGMRDKGIELLLEAKKVTGLPIGARNMQNFELLKELGKTNKPILLKRGLSSTLQELLMSAEYIMAGGNEQVILCERGIRTFETITRNTLDLSAIPLLKSMTHLPVIADPSHATGLSRLVKPMAMAAVAAGADGLLIEVHNDPANALCDGQQSLTPEEFADLADSVKHIRPYAYRSNR